MYGERRDAVDGDVAGWLERMSARLRDLEAENARLKQELADLRRGVGIAVMIDGRLMPLAPGEQTQQRFGPGTQPRAGSSPLTPQTTHVPTPALRPATQLAPVAAQHHSFGPLASTPDELPVVRGSLSAPQQPGLQLPATIEQWPESPALTQQRRPERTLVHVAQQGARGRQQASGTFPLGRSSNVSDPLQGERPQGSAERNPFADSFML